jgi:hypothetical protein
VPIGHFHDSLGKVTKVWSIPLQKNPICSIIAPRSLYFSLKISVKGNPHHEKEDFPSFGDRCRFDTGVRGL